MTLSCLLRSVVDRCWVAGLMAAALSLGATASLSAQTVDSLVGSAVKGVGPHHQDIEDAIRHFKGRDFNGARKLLESAKRKTPKLAPPEVMMARLYTTINQGALLRQELEQATRKHPQDPEAYLMLGELALADGRHTEAELLFSKGLTLVASFNENPNRKAAFQPLAYAGLATVQEAREQWEGARQTASAWAKIDPNSAAPHQRLGRILFKLGSFREAYAEFQAAYKADNKLAPAEVAMAVLYQQNGDKAAAERFLNQALKTGAKDATTRIAVGQLMIETNQLDSAQSHLDEALKLEPSSLDARLLRGMVARRKKDYETARQHLETAHIQSPSNAGVINQLALVLVEMPDDTSRRRAVEFAEMNYRQHSNHPEIAATLGWIYYRTGRATEAQQAFGAATVAGLTADTAYYLANINNHQGRVSEAIRLLDLALASESTFSYRLEAEELRKQLQAQEKSGGSETTSRSQTSAAGSAKKASTTRNSSTPKK